MLSKISNSKKRSSGNQEQCDTYKLADYNFINGYCYAHMTHYNVNETSGELLYVDNGRGMVLDKSDMSHFKVRMKINSPN